MDLEISRLRYVLVLYSLVSAVFLPPLVRSLSNDDAQSLLTLKSSFNPSKTLLLNWIPRSDVCKWEGIRECLGGRVTKLVLEHLNLTGTLDEKSLNHLDQLRVLSFKGNSISGEIPNLSGLHNLKSIYLNDNRFTGGFPESLTSLHRLKIVVLSNNLISGGIPSSVLNVLRLYVLWLQDNNFTGQIPPLNQPSLRFFNVSNNQLSGAIPVTPALVRFNLSSFSNNPNLCGDQVQNLCKIKPDNGSIATPSSSSSSSSNKKKLIMIIAGSVSGLIFLLILIGLLLCWCKCCRHKPSRNESRDVRNKGIEAGGEREIEGGEGSGFGGGGGGTNGSGGSDNGGNIGGKQGAFSWEGDGIGSLVFCGAGDQKMNYSLEDLLKASAETLGRGTIGSTYKAVMEPSKFIVTVKRLKDSRYPRQDEFRRQMEILGRLRHTNLVPIRAYFQAKEERLLVYDYFANGSLFSLIHGSKTSGGGKPLHWTSCLKIAEDLATGLVYLHQNPGLTHGNLKSSNVLLGSDFESCLTDYGLTPFRSPESLDEASASSLFYRAPECQDPRRPSTQQSDIYSFGVLLLELLTGKDLYLLYPKYQTDRHT
ncbi:hypothetical protein GIB67_035938 [Kingdonia uniflora]|uniref:Protein kinase domain-containing protein n=1 Tax=Kingdonia uniflora TaxID=39325 RepID=A0A7J7N0V2_9MAGN|nr:hypothetical protein GIB67_035938 [Kingdonia uniflora]